MAYRREGRATWIFQGRTETGWKQLATGTGHKKLAEKIEGMWEALAGEERAWDILSLVMTGSIKIGSLYDLWLRAGKNVAELRRLLRDTDLASLVAPWSAVHCANVKPDSASHALAHVRWLLPDGSSRLASAITTEWLTERLYAYTGKRNTRRKVHSSWSVFFEYCTSVRGAFLSNPMARVARPPEEQLPIGFYEFEDVQRIIDAQPTPERRLFFTVLYGTGIELSVMLGLTGADVDQKAKEIRAAGTKAITRDRMCRVADWAWPTLEAHLANKLPTARLFPVCWTRHAVSKWHRQTVVGLKLSQRLTAHAARNHWAVRAARAGTPIGVIQAQLGHGSPMLTLKKYGRFLPSAADRNRWETAATDYELERRAIG